MQTDVNSQDGNTDSSLTQPPGSTKGDMTTMNQNGTDQRRLMEVNARLKRQLAEQKQDAKSKPPESAKSLKETFEHWRATPGWRPQDASSRGCVERMVRADENNQRCELRFREAMVPPLHRDQTVNLDSSPAQWVNWRGVLLESLGAGFLYALIGIRGTGKTQMAVSIIREACRRGRSARYITAYGMLLGVREAMKSSDDTESSAIQRMITPSLLVIDEIHVRGETDFEDRTFTHIIDQRYSHKLDTIMIGNLEEKEWAASVGSSVCSRLTEKGSIINCNWESFRDK